MDYKEQDVRVWTGCIWLGIEFSDRQANVSTVMNLQVL
jgi:hypothetical protein